MPGGSRRTGLFWTAALGVIVLDAITKHLALDGLKGRGIPHEVVGNVVRFTLALNRGAAFSMSLGDYSRFVFSGAAILAMFVLWRMFRESDPNAKPRVAALGLIWGGAAGNLIDRFHYGAVVDFIDIGVPNGVRFWTFNVADSAVTVGAVLLAWVLWKEDHAKGSGSATWGDDRPSGGAAA